MYASSFSKPALSVIAILLLCSTANALQPASPNVDLKTPDIDAIVQRVIAQERVVGASVLVARGDKILLHKGYGFADLALEAPSKDETVYHVVGPCCRLPALR
jgi:CubicO group peptidase (beta-lactamase class C family)